jgi:hypothetical protein
MPGLLIGKMNTVRPLCLDTSQLVRAKHMPQSDHHAPVVQVFCPFRIHSSPFCTAVVIAPATSDPQLGSDRNCIHSSSPFKIAGTCLSFCSSVPNSNSTAKHGVNVGTCARDGYSKPRSSAFNARW